MYKYIVYGSLGLIGSTFIIKIYNNFNNEKKYSLANKYFNIGFLFGFSFALLRIYLDEPILTSFYYNHLLKDKYYY
jgi:hypothetical protein